MDTSNTTKKQVIQRISDRVYAIYESIRNSKSSRKNESLHIKKATKVYFGAVKKNLEGFILVCTDKQLKQEVQGIMDDAENMAPDGSTKLFIYHNNVEPSSSQLEFICFAIRKHKKENNNNEDVFDYCIATYSFSKHKNATGESIGAGLLTGALFWTGATLMILATGGMGAAVAAPMIMGGAGLATTGGIVLAASSDTNISASLREILEARFLYELVQRGHANIEKQTLYITHE